jgi:hypothetical protein
MALFNRADNFCSLVHKPNFSRHFYILSFLDNGHPSISLRESISWKYYFSCGPNDIRNLYALWKLDNRLPFISLYIEFVICAKKILESYKKVFLDYDRIFYCQYCFYSRIECRIRPRFYI